MFKNRSSKTEFIDDLALSSPLLIKNLQEMAILNLWLGFNRSLFKTIQKIVQTRLNNKPVVIADIGCGGGDTLRYISKWAAKKRINSKLIGFDANQNIINYASQSSLTYSNIQFKTHDILNQTLNENHDIVIISHLCHHLSNENIIKLVTTLSLSTNTAIIINDLHRHRLAYIGIRLITSIFGFSYITKHDGPLSVLKAFRKNEMISLLQQLQNASFEIKWVWPFRWQAIIWCKSI
jgi:2-polyprenyl-3-methyl-5-hydroxy-6-metoxy-1,4-benzoquinol methylase